MILHLLPTSVSRFIIERPVLRYSEVTVIMVEIKPVDLNIRHLFSLFELIGNGFCCSPLEPPVMVGFGRITRPLRLPLVVDTARPAVCWGCFRCIILNRTTVAECLRTRSDGWQRRSHGFGRRIGYPHLHLIAAAIVPCAVRDGTEPDILHLSVSLQLLRIPLKYDDAIEQVFLEM